MTEDITILLKIANDNSLSSIGKVVKSYEEGIKDGQKELLEELSNDFQPDVRNDVILPSNLEDWINNKLTQLENNK